MTADHSDIRQALQDLASDWNADEAMGERIRNRLPRSAVDEPRRWWPAAVAVAAAVMVVAAAVAVVRVGDDRAGDVVTADEDASAADASGWRPLSTAPIEGRAYPAAVWTGQEMLVWGGTSLDGQRQYDDGARYDPSTDAWTPMSPSPGTGRYTVAAWSGTELLLWGHVYHSLDDDTPGGLAYDPASDSWRVLPDAPVPSRAYSAGSWTGRELIVWGGYDIDADGYVSGADDGAAYDPASDAWRPLGPGPLEGRYYHDTVWTGQELIIWGGAVGDGAEGRVFDDGAAYDPPTDTWRELPPAPFSARMDATLLWAGNEGRVVVWGGIGAGPDSPNDGTTYDPSTDQWGAVIQVATPGDDKFRLAPAWVGDELVVLRAEPGQPLAGVTVTPSGTTESLPPAPIASREQAAVTWTGTELLVWGGATPEGPIDDGAAWHHQVPVCSPVGEPTTTVPDVRGFNLDRAQVELRSAGLELVDGGVVEGDDTSAQAKVSALEPGAGELVPLGSCVGMRTAEPLAQVPAPGEPLADGRHAVHIADLSVDDGTITVDVIQWLEGSEADDAYAAETGDTSGAPNDYYIRNDSNELRTLPIRTDTATVAFTDTGVMAHDLDVDGLLDYLAKRRDPDAPFWITLEDGAVQRIEEQYRP